MRSARILAAMVLSLSLLLLSASAGALDVQPLRPGPLPGLDLGRLPVRSAPSHTIDDGRHPMAVAPDGTVWQWGLLSAEDRFFEPEQVAGIDGVVEVSGRWSVAFARKADGTVYAWGKDDHDLIGEGASFDHPTPVQIPGLRAVALEGSFAVLSSGELWSAGSGWANFGIVPGLPSIVQAADSGAHHLALDSAGNVWAWGNSVVGELGLGEGAYSGVPAQIPSITGVIDIAAVEGRSVAVRSDGTVWEWGRRVGFSKFATTEPDRFAEPHQVPGITDVVQVETSSSHSVALRRDGTVWVWGYNGSGELGPDARAFEPVPVQVSLPAPVTEVSAALSRTLVRYEDGTLAGWGSAHNGGLGGAFGSTGSPVWLFDSVPWTDGGAIGSLDLPVLRLVGPARIPSVGEEFPVDVMLTNGANIAGVDLCLNYGWGDVTAVDADPAQPGMQATPGPEFQSVVSPIQAMNHVCFRGARTASTDEAKVATVTFRRNSAEETTLGFSQSFNLQLQTADLGASLARIKPLRIPAVTASVGSVSGEVTLQGRSSAGVAIRVVGQPGRTTVTDESGRFLISGLKPGTVMLVAELPGFLPGVYQATVQSGRTATAEMQQPLLPGDLNGDYRSGMDDLVLFARLEGKRAGAAGFDARADFNADGVIDAQDRALMQVPLWVMVPPAESGAPTATPLPVPGGTSQTESLVEVRVKVTESVPVGEEFPLTVTVTNRTGSPRSFVVHLDLPDDISTGWGERTFRQTDTIPAGGSVTLYWNLLSQWPGEKDILVSASTDGTAGSARVELKVTD